jgi:hypothetical protein
MQMCTRARYAAIVRMHAAVNCCNLSGKARLSFFRFFEEADRYRNVAVEIQDISKNILSHRISMLFGPFDMISSVIGDNDSPISIKRRPAVPRPIGALGFRTMIH